jgi:excisionase family DNA binding protein
VDDLLTARQLQELLQVDRITIYRMLNDGRLHGFKVGGQWRFSRREIEIWLQEQQSQLNGAEEHLPLVSDVTPTPNSLPLACIQAIQGVCAEALDIAAVTTDLEGTPLAEIENSSAFCELILSTPEGVRRCAADWSTLSNGEPHTCHAGLLCSSAPIIVNDQQVAITTGCQFATQALDSSDQEGWDRLSALATELGISLGDLEATASAVRIIPQQSLPRVSHLIERVADTFSEIGQERLELLSRLQHISEMSKI